MDEKSLALELWEEAWAQGRDSVAWSKMLEGLTAQQALWRPDPQRHSIWQIVNHIIFWRDVVIRRGRGEKISEQALNDEIARRNWEAPATADGAAWRALRQQWDASIRQFIDAIGAGIVDAGRSLRLLQHDQYHAGQIMYVRAMMGLPPLE